MQAAPTHSPTFAVTAVQQGTEERWLHWGDWQRERPFLLTLAVRAFPSMTDVPLKSCLASSHLFTPLWAARAAEASLCPANLAGCSCTVRAGTRQHFSSAVGNELC